MRFRVQNRLPYAHFNVSFLHCSPGLFHSIRNWLNTNSVDFRNVFMIFALNCLILRHIVVENVPFKHVRISDDTKRQFRKYILKLAVVHQTKLRHNCIRDINIINSGKITFFVFLELSAFSCFNLMNSNYCVVILDFLPCSSVLCPFQNFQSTRRREVIW